jgi:hypothetical protein
MVARAAFSEMAADTLGFEGNRSEDFERWRRGLSLICMCVFGLSFAGLLGLSATVYWTPDNLWIAFLDRAWRISGLVGLVLWAIPYLIRGRRKLGETFSGKD